MKSTPPPRPEARFATHRQKLLDLLGKEPLSARELSAAVGLPEKEVYVHLEHLQRSLRRGPKRLVVTAPVCRKCGFSFAKRTRLNRPSRCPVCRAETISEALFAVR